MPARAILRTSVPLALLAVSPATAAESPYAEGTAVEVAGDVTDAAGKPLAGVQVILEGSRRAFDVARLTRRARGKRRVAATTDGDGKFSITWNWHDFFNHFELLAGVPTPRAEGTEDFQELERLELSRRILQGSPVPVSIKIEDAGPVERLNSFVATVDTEDEARILEQMGRPERVQNLQYPEYTEVSWWYFSSGKAYRFRDGNLEQVIHFEPIEPFGS